MKKAILEIGPYVTVFELGQALLGINPKYEDLIVVEANFTDDFGVVVTVNESEE